MSTLAAAVAPAGSKGGRAAGAGFAPRSEFPPNRRPDPTAAFRRKLRRSMNESPLVGAAGFMGSKGRKL
ncbi:MAG: hypothetical protein DMG10_29840 [Acidobacteria bacterium]|nr:MAG: hypothetical protein DMG10_29840 [Acidobacteriota bacterium]